MNADYTHIESEAKRKELTSMPKFSLRVKKPAKPAH